MPLIRVVIPVYNRADLIGAALESVQAQTFRDLEVVVADDGSSDGTPRVVRRYAAEDPRIRLLELAHAGVAKARNAAIGQLEDHQCVAFLDSDDIWMPTHLERAVMAFGDSPEASVYFSRVDMDDVAKMWSPERLEAHCKRMAGAIGVATPLGSELYWLDSDIARKSFVLNEFYPQTSSVVVRASAVSRDSWFRPDLKVLEDCEFFLWLAANGSHHIFDDQLHVRMRRFGDNLSGIPDVFSARAAWRLASALTFRKLKLSFCRSRGEREHVVSQIAEAAYFLAQNCAERLEFADARAAYIESLKHRVSFRAAKGLLAAMPGARWFRMPRSRRASATAAAVERRAVAQSSQEGRLVRARK